MATTESPSLTNRLVSLDAYRGLVMLAMVSAGFGFSQVARQFPDSPLWQTLAYQFDHVEWTGCAFWDLIQPSFMFIVGVALPFSMTRRRARGDSEGALWRHVLLRSLILVALGVFLYSNGKRQTNFIFPNVLAQIGLAYPFVFLAVGRSRIVQTLGLAAVLGLSWYFFYHHPVGTAELAQSLGIPADWQKFEGFAAHWNKHLNAAGAFDRWFLNLFPRPAGDPFVFNAGGYQTLNFVPSIATMIVGVMAGELLIGPRSPTQKRSLLLGGGLLCLALPMAADHTIWPSWLQAYERPAPDRAIACPTEVHYLTAGWTLCPTVKKIWTPTFALFGAGWSLCLLAAFYTIVDLWGWTRWAFPLVVVGMNSIAIYLLDSLAKSWIVASLKTHLGQQIFSGTYGPITERVAPLVVLWLFAWWLYRQRVFFRI